jgi:hypothetical protein
MRVRNSERAARRLPANFWLRTEVVIGSTGDINVRYGSVIHGANLREHAFSGVMERPFALRKRTLGSATDMSALCQKRGHWRGTPQGLMTKKLIYAEHEDVPVIMIKRQWWCRLVLAPA